MEITYPAIKISDSLSVLVDEKATINKGDYFVSLYEDESYLEIQKSAIEDFKNWADSNYTDLCRKVIASIYGTLEGVPRIELPDNAETAAANKFDYLLPEGDGTDITSIVINGCKRDFISGYKAAQANGCYTEAQLRKAFETFQYKPFPHNTWPTFEEVITSLNQPKEIESVTLSTFKYPDGNYGFNEDIIITDGKIIPVKINYK